MGTSDDFEVTVGLHQGSALSPFPFVILIDYLIEIVDKESQLDMLFADDVVLSDETKEEVEKRLEEWRAAMEDNGMHVSTYL